ncbi:uncharacterized protein [Chelonus insularis]|uniref:uncharacterized protein n=1 Tax=Chelonus insularis TaxID=460826 RepID=UPI00158EC9D8|nr:uncharacterized protein LOC118068288 [Chelonus insularis]
MNKNFYWCFVIITICVTYSQSEQRFYARLPKNIIPKFYDLKLWIPDILNYVTYKGQVIIDFCITTKSHSIILNVDGLIIQKNRTKILNYDSYNDAIKIITQDLDIEKQFFKITSDKEFNIGNYSLYLYFTGKIRDDLFGFYRSKSKQGNETRWMAVTQFSPSYARQAFPCFDEPYLKAQFKLHIGHYDHFKVTSNTLPEQVSKTFRKNYVITSMKTTPKMSTYLFGWAIHDFDYFYLLNLTMVGMWTRKTMKEESCIALQEGWLIYKALKAWLNIENPIEKMEHIAVTNFYFNAMENWGMITFRESAVLYNKNITPTKSIHNGLSTMGHEYAHTWFGNLVTPEFWNVGWLKEGFATYFSYFGRSLVHPESRMIDLFIIENVQEALDDDAQDHNRTMNGRNPAEVQNTLGYADFVTYKKGASIIRMIEQIMGERLFQAALQSYLNNLSYSFVTPSILYTYLRNYTTVQQLVFSIDIGEITETYANQPGYPLITVTRNYSDFSIRISQGRFYQHSNWTTKPKAQRWWIPLNFMSDSQRNSNVSVFGSTWVKPHEKDITIKFNIDPQEWIICDIDKAGYYRVNYDDRNWNMLISHLGSSAFNTIRPIARATLIDDAFNLARGGYIHYRIAFRLVNYLTQEIEYEPWYVALKSLGFLQRIFQDFTTLQDSLQNYVKSILNPAYVSISFERINEGQLRSKLLRNLILSAACKFQNDHCLKTAKSVFQSWMKNSSNTIEPDLKSFVYCVGIQSGDAEVWKKVFRRFIQSDLHNEKELLIEALGCTDNSMLIKQFLNFATFNNTVALPEQYRIVIFYKILDGSRKNINYLLDFMSENIKNILETKGQLFFYKILNAIKTRITSKENLTKLYNFFEENIDVFNNTEIINDTIIYATNNVDWIKKYAPIIAIYIESLSMIGQSKTIPQNYEILLDFGGNNDDCSVKNCIYTGEVNITLKVTGRTDFFSIQADSKMKIDEKKTRIVAIALLIPNRAYRLFPCLSDLKWLSTFELSIIHPTEFSVLSGTPLKYRKKMAPNTSISVYQSTEKIQAHHVFFAIWSYKKYETDTINFWYPSEIEDEDVKMLIVYYIHSFGLMMNNTFSSKSRFNVVSFPGSRVIDFYTTRGVSLLSKDKQKLTDKRIIMTRSCSSRESRVIFDKDESTTTDRMEMLTDISRSTVRYWIGILHFPRFWDDYWIYTAIADYIATFIFHVIEPTFRIHDFSLARTILWTRCDRDTMAASTIPFYLFDTWEDRKYFRKEEYISYQALTIVATIHQLFDFKDIMGLIRLFLSRWGNESFGPTLKEMLSLLDNKSVESFTNDWLKNRGTPLITITLDELGEYAEIVQERFNTFGPGSTVNYTWTIPIRCINHQTNKFYHLWLKSKSLFVNATEIKFCLLSGHSVVPYRVNYPEAWWIDIIQLLRHNHLAISEMQRMWIIDDLYELSVAGYIHIEYLYHLFEYLKMEFDYFPWLAVGKVFGKLKNMLSLSKYENHKAFHRRLLVGLISNVYNTLKMEPTQSHENYYIRLHRKNIMNLACTYGHEDCLKESEWRLDCYLNAVSHDCPKGLPFILLKTLSKLYFYNWKYFRRCSMKWKKCASNPDVREIIFCQGLRHATPKFWYKAFQLLNGSTLFHSTRLVISRGLACTENIHILENYLDFMLNDEKIFPGENVFPILLTAARMSEEHAQLILIQTAHEYHKHSAQIAEEIYSDESVRKTSKHMPDDEEVSYLLPENVKKVLTANTKIANKILVKIAKQVVKSVDWLKMLLLKALLSTLFLVTFIQGIPLSPKDSEFVNNLYSSRAVPGEYRLPSSVVPNHYDLVLEPWLEEEKFTFDGRAIIDITVKEANKKIYLHAKELTITKEDVKLSNTSTELKVETIDIDKEKDFLMISFLQPVPIGNWTLTIKYKGILNDQLTGFYRSSYKNILGEIEWMASTHFEPVGARQAFPCWDEPALKATFKISIRHNRRYNVISNMPDSETIGIDKKTTSFPQTPKMSTYLVAFVVANFDYIESQNNSLFRIWARKNMIQHGKYASEVGYEELKALENFTNISFEEHKLGKMDSVALPQLSAGAMENWGIVTYRESGLLVEENVTSTFNKEAVAKVISHEFAHQWFGNLVTPEWWTYVWLNEGFATYFQYFITDQVTETWRLMDRFVVEVLQGSAFIADGTNTSHAMDVSVESQQDVSKIFDNISYRKAGSVIRMFSYVLGEEKFQSALQSYLKKKMFGVSTSKDLIEEFASVSADKDVKTAFTSWVTQPGYPVLTVTRHYANGSATLKQSRFLYNQTETSKEKYWIPYDNVIGEADDKINFNRTKIEWLKPDETVKTITGIKNDTWIIFNKQQFGYYRVNYDELNWKLIGNALETNHSKIHILNRAQLVDDAFNLARVRLLPYNVTFRVLQYLKQEADYVPWYAAWNGFSHLSKILANTDQSQPFKDYVLRLTGALVNDIKFEESVEDDHIKKLQRVTVIEKTCAFGLKSCANHTSEKLRKWLESSDANPLSPDLKSVVLCGGVRSANRVSWNKLLQKYKNEQDENLITALGCTSDVEILKDYLRMTFNGTLKSANRDQVFKSVYSGSENGINVALDFIISDSKLINGNDAKNETLIKYITEIGERITTDSQLKKIENSDFPPNIISAGVYNAKKNIEWLGLQMSDIQNYFKVESNDPDSASIYTLSTMLLVMSIAFTVLHYQSIFLKMIEKVILFVVFLYVNSGSSAYGNDQHYVTRLLAKVLSYRLPNDTVPISYVLQIEPHIDAENFTFNGEGTLIFQVEQPLKDITLHANNLEIDKSYTRLIASDGTSWKPISQKWNSILEFFNIKFDNELKVGRYSLKLKWKGYDAHYWRGFYRAVDEDSSGRSTYMIATHFQPTAARNAFPCWDEPGLKAEFEIALKHYPNYTAISNMPVRSRVETDDGKILTHFEKTPIMSTYLVTFIVANYAKRFVHHDNLTFYTTVENIRFTSLAYEVSEAILYEMENYTKIPYSLPKLDQVTIPQYSSSATEHWGAISYWTNLILYKEFETSVIARDRIVYLTAHELSHQWFGNLVTPAWWDDLWLSEAFAVYFTYKMTDLVFPYWNSIELFITEVVHQISYNAESRGRVPRPIKWYPASPTEIRQMFTPVTYRKGAAVLRMLEHIVTEEVFRDGITKYLNKHRFGVVTTNDLWRALQDTYQEKGVHPHLNIKKIMDPWLEQTGFPILKVVRDYKTGIANVTQSNALDQESDNLWMIPVTLTTSTHPDFNYTKPTHWIPRSRDNYTFYGIDKDDWVILNVQQTGFYRVNYDYENWKRLADYLNTDNYEKIHVINRAQIIFDIFDFMKNDKMYVEPFFDIALYLYKETNFLPWMPILSAIESLNQLLINTPVYDLFSKLMLHLMNNIVDHVGFEDQKYENHLDALARYYLLPWACTFDHQKCKEAAQTKFIKHFKDPEKYPINQNEEIWVYCNGLQASNESVWEEVMNAHLANPLFQSGFEYLGCTDNQYLIRKYLNLAMAENATQLTDLISDAFISIMAGKRENVIFVLDYFVNHIDRIREYYNIRNMTGRINIVIQEFSYAIKSSEQYNQFVDFLTNEEKKGKMQNVDETLERARDSMETSEKVSSTFHSLLSKKPGLFDSLQC